MSKHTTLDQLKMLAQRSKAEIDKVDTKVDNLTTKVEDLVTAGGEPNVITGVKFNGEALAVGADKYIYMVPKTGSDEDDLYDEYMVLDGKVEYVGNTKVDLSGYVQKEDGAGLYPDADKEKLAGIVMATNDEVAAALDEVFGPKTSEATEP